MAMLHFRPVDRHDLRCAYACAKMLMQGLGWGNTVFWQGLGALPWPCYIFDLLIPAICDAHTRAKM